MNSTLHNMRRLARAVATGLLVAFAAACSGGTATMQPVLSPSDVPTETADSATSCAGDVCFTYAD